MNKSRTPASGCSLLLMIMMASQSISLAQTTIDGFAPQLSDTEHTLETSFRAVPSPATAREELRHSSLRSRSNAELRIGFGIERVSGAAALSADSKHRRADRPAPRASASTREHHSRRSKLLQQKDCATLQRLWRNRRHHGAARLRQLRSAERL